MQISINFASYATLRHKFAIFANSNKYRNKYKSWQHRTNHLAMTSQTSLYPASLSTAYRFVHSTKSWQRKDVKKCSL